MTRGEEFEALRPLLFSIAYRILGSVAEAEDAVQDPWLRYETFPTQPTSTKAFLAAVVARVSIDVLRSARRPAGDLCRALVSRLAEDARPAQENYSFASRVCQGENLYPALILAAIG